MILVRLVRVILLAVLLVAGLWLVGLQMFVQHIESMKVSILDPAPMPVDAIVVLTGGSERVKTGVDLLNSGSGKKLFISGVHPGLSLDGVLNGNAVRDDLRACCVVLGYTAESTEGNAEETRDWMALEGYHSLRLVTANYHMPRSLLLFQHTMPQMAILPYAIAPDSVLLDEWWKHSGTASLLAVEFDKYLWASMMLNLEML